ncbi:ubiquitin carboxyl-terminal hydrolase faf-x-related [Anaeramoeba flamelloides]|uniref:Ubiquitin carboxyl-terminal hydrolase faf-x-related n=1 Tax=Anaeramoeba flamelloides TaxID=1746091 RepID=A0ABQ8YXC5_9EUKA|nr:ubiquitin carboxyl-terminal hydrolase faf-x-related [Anaeramoeba flamelloides]
MEIIFNSLVIQSKSRTNILLIYLSICEQIFLEKKKKKKTKKKKNKKKSKNNNKKKDNNKEKNKEEEEKLILGFKVLLEIIKNILELEKKSKNNKIKQKNRKEYADEFENKKLSIIDWITKRDLIKRFLIQEEKSLNLIQYINELLFFIGKYGKIPNDIIDLIWNIICKPNCNRQLRQILQKSISTIAGVVNVKQIQYLDSKIRLIKPKNYNFGVIELINNFTEATINLNDPRLLEISEFGLNVMWDLIQENSTASSSLSKRAKAILKNLLSNKNGEQFRNNFLKKCIDNLKNHNSVLLSLKLIIDILNFTNNEKNNSLKEKQISAQILSAERKYKILKFFFDDLVDYRKKSNEELKKLIPTKKKRKPKRKLNNKDNKNKGKNKNKNKKGISMEREMEMEIEIEKENEEENENKTNHKNKKKKGNENQTKNEKINEKKKINNNKKYDFDITTIELIGKHTHYDQIQNRLKFLNFFITKSKLFLNFQQIETLWETFVIQSISNEEINMFYKWLETTKLDEEGKNSTFEKGVINQLFIEEICKFNVKTMDLPSFQLFKRFFIFINEKMNKIEKEYETKTRIGRIERGSEYGRNTISSLFARITNRKSATFGGNKSERFHIYGNGKYQTKVSYKDFETGKYLISSIDLIKGDYLWKIVLNSANEQVFNSSNLFLSRLFAMIAIEIRKNEENRKLIFNHFIKKIINYIQNFIDNNNLLLDKKTGKKKSKKSGKKGGNKKKEKKKDNDHDNKEEKKEHDNEEKEINKFKLLRLLQLLRLFIDSFDKRFTFENLHQKELLPHKQIKYLKPITIFIKCTNSYQFHLMVHSNLYFEILRKMISMKIENYKDEKEKEKKEREKKKEKEKEKEKEKGKGKGKGTEKEKKRENNNNKSKYDNDDEFIDFNIGIEEIKENNKKEDKIKDQKMKEKKEKEKIKKKEKDEEKREEEEKKKFEFSIFFDNKLVSEQFDNLTIEELGIIKQPELKVKIYFPLNENEESEQVKETRRKEREREQMLIQKKKDEMEQKQKTQPICTDRLPAELLSQKKYFLIFYKLLEYDYEIAKISFELLEILPTNSYFSKKYLKFKNNIQIEKENNNNNNNNNNNDDDDNGNKKKNKSKFEYEKFSNLLNSNNYYKLLYNFQIIEKMLIINHQELEKNFLNINHIHDNNWSNNFIKSNKMKYFRNILNDFTKKFPKIMDLYHPNKEKNLINFEKNIPMEIFFQLLQIFSKIFLNMIIQDPSVNRYDYKLKTEFKKDLLKSFDEYLMFLNNVVILIEKISFFLNNYHLPNIVQYCCNSFLSNFLTICNLIISHKPKFSKSLTINLENWIKLVLILNNSKMVRQKADDFLYNYSINFLVDKKIKKEKKDEEQENQEENDDEIENNDDIEENKSKDKKKIQDNKEKLEKKLNKFKLIINKLNLFLIESENYQKTIQEYFDLYIKLLTFVEKNNFKNILDKEPIKMINEIINLILKHPILELNDTIESRDSALSGLLKLGSYIINQLNLDKNVSKIKESLNEKYNLVNLLFNEFLFPRIKSNENENENDDNNNNNDLLPKCKTYITRTYGYQFLGSLLWNCETNYQNISLKLFDQLSQLKMKTNNWNYGPFDKQLNRNISGYVGLINQGATCYLNSVMQQLFKTPEFCDSILNLNIRKKVWKRVNDQNNNNKMDQNNDDDNDDDDDDDKKNNEDQIDVNEKIKNIEQYYNDNEKLLNELKKMFIYLKESKKSYYNTKKFCRSIIENGRPINTREQKDANEYLNKLFDKIDDCLKNTKNENLLKNIYGGNLIHQIICQEKFHSSERTEDFFTVSLEVKNKRTLKESLQLFVQGDMLNKNNQYHCSNCEHKVDAIKRCCFLNLPNTLIFHLKRFDFDFDLLRNVKINSLLEFPHELNMRPYTLEGIIDHEINGSEDEDDVDDNDEDGDDDDDDSNDDDDKDGNEKKDQKEIKKENIKKENELYKSNKKREKKYYEYQLVGVVIHSGSSDFGHYYSFIKDRDLMNEEKNTQKNTKNIWNTYDDSRVTRFNIDTLPRRAFGSVEQTVDDPRGESRRNNGYMLFYERKEKIMAPQKDEHKNINNKLINKSKKKFQINDIIHEIKNQNRILEYEKIIYSQSFINFSFNFMSEMFQKKTNLLTLKNINFSKNKESKLQKQELELKKFQNNSIYSKIIKISTLFIIKILSHTSSKNEIRKWILPLNIFYSNFTSECSWFFAQCLKNHHRWINEMVFLCPSLFVQHSFNALIKNIMNIQALIERDYYYDEIKNDNLIKIKELENNGKFVERKKQLIKLTNNVYSDSDNSGKERREDEEEEELVPKSLLIRFINYILNSLNLCLKPGRSSFSPLKILIDFIKIGEKELNYLILNNAIQKVIDFYQNEIIPFLQSQEKLKREAYENYKTLSNVYSSNNNNSFKFKESEPQDFSLFVELIYLLIKGCEISYAKSSSIILDSSDGNIQNGEKDTSDNIESNDKPKLQINYILSLGAFFEHIVENNVNLKYREKIIKLLSKNRFDLSKFFIQSFSSKLNRLLEKNFNPKPYFYVLLWLSQIDDRFTKQRVKIIFSEIMHLLNSLLEENLKLRTERVIKNLWWMSSKSRPMNEIIKENFEKIQTIAYQVLLKLSLIEIKENSSLKKN